MNYLGVILTSAVVASIISGLFVLLNDFFRRKSEEKIYKFETAVKLTKMRDEQIGEFLKRTEKKIKWPSPLNTFRLTLKEIERIWKSRS